MRDYGRVHTSFWCSLTMRSLSEDARMLVLYLLTSPHSNIAGVFRLPDGYVCEDMQWSSDRVNKGFEELFRKGFANRCETTKWVYICSYLEWNRPENPNQRKAAKRIALMVPDECEWKLDFMRDWREFLEITEDEFPNPSETVNKGLPQEQEQEQEYISPEQQEVAQGSKPLFDNPEQEPQALETLTLADKSEHLIFDDDIQQWAEAYPGVDIRGELKRMKAWLNANPRRRKTKRGINAFVVNWLSRQQDNPRPQARSGSQGRVHDDYSSFHHEVAI